MTESEGKEQAAVLVVDDHDLVRQGMAKLIENTPWLTLHGAAEGSDDAKALMADRVPDVAVVDLSLKKGDGFSLIQYIVQKHPDVKIVVSSIHEDAGNVQRALQAGAHGYVAKSAPVDSLLEAIEKVLRGELYVPPELSERVLSRMRDRAGGGLYLELLSEREREVFTLIGEGLTTRKIADRLHRSTKTVETHVERIKEKLKVPSAHELHRLAFQYQGESEGR